MNIAIRLFLGAALLAAAGFCVFGFMATYEYPDPGRRLPWQAGYGGLGLTFVGLAVLCFAGWSSPVSPGRARLWAVFAGLAAAFVVICVVRALGYEFLTVGAGVLAGIIGSVITACCLRRQAHQTVNSDFSNSQRSRISQDDFRKRRGGG